MDYFGAQDQGRAGLDLTGLEQAFQSGVKLFLFSNPNNPTGVIYSREEIVRIAALAKKYGATLIVDELYSRQVFDGRAYTHLCAQTERPDNLVTIIGPLQDRVSERLPPGRGLRLRRHHRAHGEAPGHRLPPGPRYCQAVFASWFAEPQGWMEQRVADHQAIRDSLLSKFLACPGVTARTTEAGSYLFPKLPPLAVSGEDFVKILRAHAGRHRHPGH